jgi:hypothetical protein
MSCVYPAYILLTVALWQNVYGVCTVQMPLPGRCVSAGAFVRNYGATNVTPILKTAPLVEEDAPFSNI